MPEVTTAEQAARDMLERMGIEGAQSFSAGDVVELANVIRRVEREGPDRWDQMRARLKTRVASGNLKRSTVAKMLLSVMDDLEKEGAEA